MSYSSYEDENSGPFFKVHGACDIDRAIDHAIANLADALLRRSGLSTSLVAGLL